MAQCQAITKGGRRCRQHCGEAETFCLWHDPKRKERAALMRARGGASSSRNKRKTPPPEELPTGAPTTAEEAMRWSSWLTFATASGKIDPRTSAQVASSLRVFLQSLEKADMERQLKELQRQVEDLKKGGKR